MLSVGVFLSECGVIGAASPCQAEFAPANSLLAKTVPPSAPTIREDAPGSPSLPPIFSWEGVPKANAPAWPAYIRRKQAGGGSGGATPTLPGRHVGQGWKGICCVVISPASFLLSFL